MPERIFFLIVLWVGSLGISSVSTMSYAGLFGDDKAREQISALQNQVAEMEARIAKMEEALKSQALLDLYSQVETMGVELGLMRGQLEMLSNDSAVLQKRQRDFYIDLDTRIRQIENPGEVILPVIPDEFEQSSVPVESASEHPVAASPITELIPANEVESSAYDAAYLLFLNGDYNGAVTGFERFLEDYPQSSLAPGAAYWVGNTYYAMRDFQKAIDTQNKLIAIYPDSPKVPDALLNIASSLNEMNNKKASKQTLEELIAKYPFSGAADKAKQRLASF